MGYSEDTISGRISAPEVVEQPCGLYPALHTFSRDYGADDYRDWVEQSNGDPVPAPLVVYVQNEAPGGSLRSGVSPAHLNESRVIEHELRLQGRLFDADETADLDRFDRRPVERGSALPTGVGNRVFVFR